MLWNARFAVGAALVAFMLGCQPVDQQSSTSNEELRVLTPNQEKLLLEKAERVEKKDVVRQDIVDDKGVVVGTVTSQTTVVYLKQASGGGRFSMNASCTSTCKGAVNSKGCSCDSACGACTGNPIDLDPGSTDNTCKGTCTKSTTGFGNFGIFMAINPEGQSGLLVAQNVIRSDSTGLCPQ